MGDTTLSGTEAQLRAGVYGRLSETYDAAESVPTQLERGSAHASRRGWVVAARFKDDGYSPFKEITRDGFGDLIEAIERGQIDVVIVGDIDRLTRNLTDWNRFEKARVRHGVLLSPYTGADLDLSTPEGAYYGGMETLRAKRESAVKSARVREAADREARKGNRAGGGQRWFGYTRIYVNPDEPDHRKRIIVREDINPAEAEALREAARRVLEFGEPVGAILRDWHRRGMKPVAAKEWSNTSLVLTLTSARLAGLREWRGQKYPTTQWPAIFDRDTHERLVKLFSDLARRRGAVCQHVYLLSGMPVCPKCGRRMYYRDWKGRRADSYAWHRGARPRLRRRRDQGRPAGGVRETGAVLDAMESPRVQEALRAGTDPNDTRRADLLVGIQAAQQRRADARRDYAEGTIDWEDWLDIRDRTEQAITTARRAYDRLSGSATVTSDIPASERVRDAWESWNVSRRRAAIKAVLHRIIIKPLPPGAASNPGGRLKDAAERRDREMAILRQRVEFDWRV